MKFFKTKKYSILSNLLKCSFVVALGVMLVMPVVFAADAPGGGVGAPGGGVGSNITTTIDNPLGNNITDIPSFIKEVVNIVLVVGIPILALAIIYTGFLFVQAQGNSEKLTKAKNALLYTLIGGALLLGAFVIANAIKETVDSIKSAA